MQILVSRMYKVQFIEVADDIEGQRIDNYLIAQLPKIPKSLIYRWIRKGELRVNKKRVKQTSKVKAGDLVRVPPFNLDESVDAVAKVSDSHLEFLEKLVLLETDDYIVFNKPSGMAVHGGSGVNSGLIERLRLLRPRARRVDLVHRLDKETSGCVILAKKHSSLVYFFDLFKERKIDKIYYAIVHGKWDKKITKIDLPLHRTETKDGQRLVKVDHKNGKNSVTNIRSVKYLEDDYSLLEIKLETGRTHQIRVHCKAMGHPVVADKKYGFDKLDKILEKKCVNKLLLHAGKLSFIDAKSNEVVNVTSPLDDRFNALMG